MYVLNEWSPLTIKILLSVTKKIVGDFKLIHFRYKHLLKYIGTFARCCLFDNLKLSSKVIYSYATIWGEVVYLNLTHFMPMVSFYIPLKTSENVQFLLCLGGCRKRPMPWSRLIWKLFKVQLCPESVQILRNCLFVSLLFVRKFLHL